MGFVVFFFIAWLIVSIYASMAKKLSFVENTFIFLIILIININYSWIIIDEMKLISYSYNGFDYTAFLLRRSVIIPISVLILINLFEKYKSTNKDLLIFLAAILFQLGISYISNVLEVTHFKNWLYTLDAVYYLCLNFIGLLSFKLFARMSRKTVNSS